MEDEELYLSRLIEVSLPIFDRNNPSDWQIPIAHRNIVLKETRKCKEVYGNSSIEDYAFCVYKRIMEIFDEEARRANIWGTRMAMIIVEGDSSLSEEESKRVGNSVLWRIENY